MKKIIDKIRKKIKKIIHNRKVKKKIEEMRKRDPFIYPHF